jgi:hypothetical protein
MTTVQDEPATEPRAGDEPARRRPGTVGPKAPPTTPRPRAASRRPVEAAAGSPAQPATPRQAPPPRGGETRSAAYGGARLPWILAILGLLGTVGFGLAWNSARGTGSADGGTAASPQAQDVRSAAVAFSKALTNFDGSTIDRDFDRLIGLSTGGFQDQADQFFNTKTRVALKKAQASSRGEVRQAFVQSISGAKASVFVVVDQTIANNKSPQPQADTLRMDLTLKATKGTWLVDQVEVLTAPGGGSTLAPTGNGTTGSGN